MGELSHVMGSRLAPDRELETLVDELRDRNGRPVVIVAADTDPLEDPQDLDKELLISPRWRMRAIALRNAIDAVSSDSTPAYLLHRHGAHRTRISDTPGVDTFPRLLHALPIGRRFYMPVFDWETRTIESDGSREKEVIAGAGPAGERFVLLIEPTGEIGVGTLSESGRFQPLSVEDLAQIELPGASDSQVPTVDTIHRPSKRPFGIEVEAYLMSGMALCACRAALRQVGLATTGRPPAGTDQELLHDQWILIEEEQPRKVEFISPVVRDTPETWSEIENVLRIAHVLGATTDPTLVPGAKGTLGAHVHAGTAEFSGSEEAQQKLVDAVARWLDELFRLGTAWTTHGGARHRGTALASAPVVHGVASDRPTVSTIRSTRFGALNLQPTPGPGELDLSLPSLPPALALEAVLATPAWLALMPRLGHHGELRVQDGTLRKDEWQPMVRATLALFDRVARSLYTTDDEQLPLAPLQPNQDHHFHGLGYRNHVTRTMPQDQKARYDETVLEEFVTYLEIPDLRVRDQIRARFRRNNWYGENSR